MILRIHLVLLMFGSLMFAFAETDAQTKTTSMRSEVIITQAAGQDEERVKLVQELTDARIRGDRQKSREILQVLGSQEGEVITPASKAIRGGVGETYSRASGKGAVDRYVPGLPKIQYGNDVPVAIKGIVEKNPSLAAGSDGKFMMVAYEETGADTIWIRHKQSTDYGETWDGAPSFFNLSVPLSDPAVAIIGDIAYTLYVRLAGSADHDLRLFSESLDPGGSPFADVEVSGNNTIKPAMITDASFFPTQPYLYVAYFDLTDRTVKFTASRDNGLTWSSPLALGGPYPVNLLRDQISQSIAFSQHSGTNYLHVVWAAYDADDGKANVYYSSSTDFGTSWSSPARFRVTFGGGPLPIYNPSVAAYDNLILLACEVEFSEEDHDILNFISEDAGASGVWSSDLMKPGDQFGPGSGASGNSEIRPVAAVDPAGSAFSVTFVDTTAHLVYVSRNSVGTVVDNTAWSPTDANDKSPISGSDRLGVVGTIDPDGNPGVGLMWTHIFDPFDPPDFDIYFDGSWRTPSSGVLPTVATAGASSVSATSATLNGTVNPNASETTAWFEWGVNSTLTPLNSTGAQSVGSGTNAASVSENLTGLNANTTYFYRVVAQNNVGTGRGSIVSFTTGANFPIVTTSDASSVAATSATLNGSINPNSLETTAWFEWGEGNTLSEFTSTPSQSLGSGTSPVSVAENVSGLAPGTMYYFRVVGENTAGIQKGDILAFETTLDDTPPAINVVSAPTAANAGSSVTVSATAADPSGIAELYLVYFVGSAASGIRIDFSAGSATIPGNNVTVDGLDYFIRAVDNVGNSFRSRLYSVAVAVSAGELSKITPGGTVVSAYRLFSVPLNLQVKAFNSFFSGANDLGTQGTDWRFFAYNNRNPVEYGSGTTSSLIPGEAYFLITRNAKTITTKAGTTNLFTTLVENGIGLTSGWNLVGNPMSYDIRLSDFTLDPATDPDLSSMAYSWTGSGGWVQGNLALRSWDGLAIRVSGNTQLKLTNFTGPLAKSGGMLAKGKVPSDPSAKQRNAGPEQSTMSEWIVHIVAKDEDMMDQINYIGVHPDAKDSYDEFDRFEPPIIPGAVSLHFVKENWEEKSDVYTADIRPPTSSGHVWEATVVGKPHSTVVLEFSGLHQVPEDFELYAVAENGMVHNLRSQSTIQVNTSDGKRTFRLIVGTEDFVASNTQGILLTPTAFALRQNYPNPFNPSTTIRYELPLEARVTLKIYSVLGQEVATLVDEEQSEGYYETRWDATGVAASGVYFYRLDAESSGSNLFNEIRKMVLVK